MKSQTLTTTNCITGTFQFPPSFNYKDVVSYTSDLFRLFFWGVEGCCLIWLHTWTHSHSVEVLWTRDRPIPETSAYATHNLHNRHISIPTAGLEPGTSASEQPQAYATDHSATGTVANFTYRFKKKCVAANSHSVHTFTRRSVMYLLIYTVRLKNVVMTGVLLHIFSIFIIGQNNVLADQTQLIKFTTKEHVFCLTAPPLRRTMYSLSDCSICLLITP